MLSPTGKGGLIIHSFNDLSISKLLARSLGDKASVLHSFWATRNPVEWRCKKNSEPHFFLTHVVTKTFFSFLTILDAAEKTAHVSVAIFSWTLKENKIKTYCKQRQKKNARIHTKHTLKRQLFTNILHYKNLILNFFLWAVFRWNYILNWALSIYLHFSLFLIFFSPPLPKKKKIWITLSGH